MVLRSYSELSRYHEFEDRYEYLKLAGEVGAATFGYDRWLNQDFYRSTEWKHVRNFVIARDNGRDLGVEGHEIWDRIIIHHMNPLTADDIEFNAEATLDPEFLITVTHRTHNAIHYGTAKLLRQPMVDRRPGDTRLW